MCETVYLASSRSYFEPTPLHLLSTKAEATTVDDPSRRPFLARFLMYTEEKMFQVHGSLCTPLLLKLLAWQTQLCTPIAPFIGRSTPLIITQS